MGEPLVGYLLLLLLFLLFFSVSLFFAFREWRRPRDASPLPMDVDYIRIENYFGQSFRAKVREWLAEPQPNGVSAGELTNPKHRITPTGENLLLVRGGRIEAGGDTDEIVYSEGDLTIARGSVFRREIYCAGSLDTEAGAQLQSAASDGELALGENSDVARWIDANGKIVIRSGAVVRNRASSLTSIELERAVLVQSLYSPLISTAPCGTSQDGFGGGGDSWPRAHDGAAAADNGRPHYLEGPRCTRLAPGTWLVQGALELPAGTRVEENLIVTGTLTSGPDCGFLGHMKGARINLGPRNHLLGNLSAQDSVLIGEASRLERNITAGRDVRLASGTRVGRPDSPAVVSAAGEIVLEPGVAICGKASAGRWVRTI